MYRSKGAARLRSKLTAPVMAQSRGGHASDAVAGLCGIATARLWIFFQSKGKTALLFSFPVVAQRSLTILESRTQPSVLAIGEVLGFRPLISRNPLVK